MGAHQTLLTHANYRLVGETPTTSALATEVIDALGRAAWLPESGAVDDEDGRQCGGGGSGVGAEGAGEHRDYGESLRGRARLDLAPEGGNPPAGAPASSP